MKRLGRAGGDWEAWEAIGRDRVRVPLVFPLFPNLPDLRGFRGFVFHPQTQLGKGRWGAVGRSGRMGRVGRDWEAWEEIGKSGKRLGMDRVRAPLMFPLFPNLSPLFPLSVVSYSTPNPVGKGVWGAAGRSGSMGRD